MAGHKREDIVGWDILGIPPQMIPKVGGSHQLISSDVIDLMSHLIDLIS